MKRNIQETFELITFSLISILIGVAALWVAGKALGLLSFVMVWFAEFLWLILRYAMYIIIPAVIVFALMRVVQRSSKKTASPSVATVADNKTIDVNVASPIDNGAPKETIIQTETTTNDSDAVTPQSIENVNLDDEDKV